PNGKVVAQSSQKVKLEAGSSKKASTEMNVKKAQLWSLNNPVLYTLNTTILKGNEVVDKTSTKTGFRSYTFDPNKGFALNGEWQKVKGVCIHHDAGVLGSAVPKEVWERRLRTLKELGVNAIRTSHNPQSPDLYALCDEIGLLVMNEAFDEWEFPKRKWIAGWNKGTPGFQGMYDFFESWSDKDLEDMIRRDRNHLSIFAWSIGNEVDYPNDPYSHPILAGGSETGFTQPIFGGYKKEAPDAMRLGAIAKRLAAVVRKFDSSRPVTAGLAGVAMSNQTEYPGALDIAGYNYTENKYDEDHKAYPNRVIYGSENRHDLKAWYAVTDTEHIFGQFLWTGIDYLGESGAWPSRGFYSGLLDFGGFIKPRGYFRQSLWLESPMIYAGTYVVGKGNNKDVWSALEDSNDNNRRRERLSTDAWSIWNYPAKSLVRVVCYTNAPQARLMLNGEEVGKAKPYDKESGIIHWDIPFNNGKLEAQGLDNNGNIISTYAITTSKAPHAIKVERVITNKESGLSQVILQVVDEDGVNVMLADNEIQCNIMGEATLLGMEASNNEDMSDYTDNKHRVFNGRILVYIQANTEKKVKVRFTSPWLEKAEIEL
ncbi:MAG: glycoside hydrolase family 2 TIM barrel-domain containing protein, partial [Phocaeicola sp.]